MNHSMVSFNIPPCVGSELTYVKQAMDSHKICGDGQFTKKCNAWMEKRCHAKKVLLTTSGSPRWTWPHCCVTSSPATR